MKIDISNCKESVLYKTEGIVTYSEDIFDGRMISFVEPVRFVVIYQTENEAVNVQGTVTASLKGACEKCLTDMEWTLSIPFDEFFFKANVKPEEDELFRYEDDTINLSEPIMEKILEQIPIQLECSVSCKGLCQRCGVNRNEQECSCDEDTFDERNPFAILNTIAGGAKNGSTKV